MELILTDKEMDIFNCSFTQKENVLILSVNEWVLQCSEQNLIVRPFLVVFFSINSWPSKIPNGPLKMMEGANDGPQKFWPGYNTGNYWNGLKHEEKWLSPNVSVVSKQNWNKLWKRWKYQAPFLVFWNTETMDYIGKLLKRTETWRKLTKSKCFSCFETFQIKIEMSS